MRVLRCPVCHSPLHLDALLADDAGREMMNIILNKATHNCARPLVAYIALFRPAKSDLSNTRALKLMNEVLDQFSASRHLCHALHETVKSIQEKRRQGDNKPLANHNYLKRVYESTKPQFISANTKQGEPVQQSDSRDSYFEQMQRMNIDVSTLHGGKEWLEERRNKNV